MCLKEGGLKSELIARVIGCHTQMTKFNFFFGINLGQRLYSLTHNMSNSLQSKKMSTISGQRLARLTIATIESMRTEEYAQLFFDTVTKKASAHDKIDDPELNEENPTTPFYNVLKGM